MAAAFLHRPRRAGRNPGQLRVRRQRSGGQAGAARVRGGRTGRAPGRLSGSRRGTALSDVRGGPAGRPGPVRPHRGPGRPGSGPPRTRRAADRGCPGHQGVRSGTTDDCDLARRADRGPRRAGHRRADPGPRPVLGQDHAATLLRTVLPCGRASASTAVRLRRSADPVSAHGGEGRTDPAAGRG